MKDKELHRIVMETDSDVPVTDMEDESLEEFLDSFDEEDMYI